MGSGCRAYKHIHFKNCLNNCLHCDAYIYFTFFNTKCNKYYSYDQIQVVHFDFLIVFNNSTILMLFTIASESDLTINFVVFCSDVYKWLRWC